MRCLAARHLRHRGTSSGVAQGGLTTRACLTSNVPAGVHAQEMLNHLDEQLPLPQYGLVPSATDAPDRELFCSSSSVDVGTPSPASSMHIFRTGSPPGNACGGGATVSTAAAELPAAPRTPAATPPPRRCAGEPHCSTSGVSAGPDCGDGSRLYYRRQLLTRTLEGRRVEVITITDCSGATGEKEPPLPGVFEHDPGPPSAIFRDKTVFFVSSRVHPGETPATHIFNGMLAFLLRRSDPRAAVLRRRFVFKLVPLVNPDGVAVGNYRTDTLGQNLNRFYTGVPDAVRAGAGCRAGTACAAMGGGGGPPCCVHWCGWSRMR